MPKGIVNVLEVVQVEKHHANQGAFASCLGQGQFQAIQGEHPVGKPGQDVVVSLSEQLLLVALANADIFAKNQVAGGFALGILDGGYDQLFPEALTVLANAVDFPLPDPHALDLKSDGLPQLAVFSMGLCILG